MWRAPLPLRRDPARGHPRLTAKDARIREAARVSYPALSRWLADGANKA